MLRHLLWQHQHLFLADKGALPLRLYSFLTYPFEFQMVYSAIAFVLHLRYQKSEHKKVCVMRLKAEKRREAGLVGSSDMF